MTHGLDALSLPEGVIVIAATNFPELLDKCVFTASGGFILDPNNLLEPLFDLGGSIRPLLFHFLIFEAVCKYCNITCATCMLALVCTIHWTTPFATSSLAFHYPSEVDINILARGTPGFSGAELENMINQVCIRYACNSTQYQWFSLCVVEGCRVCCAKEGDGGELEGFRVGQGTPFFNSSKLAGFFVLTLSFQDKILMGAERTSAYIPEDVKRCTAVHEGGHALVAIYTRGSMPLHKVTCIPRGHALGLVRFLCGSLHTKAGLIGLGIGAARRRKGCL
jgi:ATP-dependent metalloprotease